MGGGGRISRKKMETYKMKNKFCIKFHPNWTMGKGSKIRGRLGNITDQPTDEEKPRYTRKWLCLRLGNIFTRGISTLGLK